MRQGRPRPPRRSGSCVVGRARSVDLVGADVDRAQPQAVAGLNHPLLIAVADAGVDIEAAEAEAVAPAAMSPAAMEAVRGSGSHGGNAEGSRGDQSESNLAKHGLISSVGEKPLLCPCPSVGSSAPHVHGSAQESCFRSVSSGRVIFEERAGYAKGIPLDNYVPLSSPRTRGPIRRAGVMLDKRL